MPNIPDKNVNAFIDRCSDAVGKYQNEVFSQGMFSEIYDRISSPIEQYLYVALETVAHLNAIKIEIIAQFVLEKFRADFLVRHTKRDGKVSQIIVECDSQAFHDRSEPERRYEKARERRFVKEGFRVMHFTGKEIMETPILHAAEIIACLTDEDLQKDCVEWVQEYNPSLLYGARDADQELETVSAFQGPATSLDQALPRHFGRQGLA
jgi:very-short-patch-repair endonuclease